MPEDPIAEMLRQAAEYKRAEQEARREASDMTHESFLHVRDHAAEQYERLLGRVEERVERLRASVLPVPFESEREGNRLDVVCAPIRLRLRFPDDEYVVVAAIEAGSPGGVKIDQRVLGEPRRFEPVTLGPNIGWKELGKPIQSRYTSHDLADELLEGFARVVADVCIDV